MTNQSAQPITEKDLAEKLESISASMLGLDKKEAWTRVAREAAELMGYEFTPEKPEPGTWHLTDNFTPGREFPAFVDAAGHLLVCDPPVPIVRWDRDEAWPDLTPARVLPDGEKIDPADVRVGDRVRLVLRNGEATFIVANAYNNSLHSMTNTYYERDITAAYLLDREGETND